MADEMMNKIMDMFGSSHQWGQTNNSSFIKFLMNENEHLKTELQRLRIAAEKQNDELVQEVARLHRKVKEYKTKLSASANHSSYPRSLYEPETVSQASSASDTNNGSLRSLHEQATVSQVTASLAPPQSTTNSDSLGSLYEPVTPQKATKNNNSLRSLHEPATVSQVTVSLAPPQSTVNSNSLRSLYEPVTSQSAINNNNNSLRSLNELATVSQVTVSPAPPQSTANSDSLRSLYEPATSQSVNYIPTPISQLTPSSVSGTSPTLSSNNHKQPTLITNTLEYHPSPINRFHRRRQGADGKQPQPKMAKIGPSAVQFKTPSFNNCIHISDDDN